MAKKFLIFSALPILGVGILAANFASAHGFFGFWGAGSNATSTPQQITTNYQNMFNQEAQILGISVDDVKAAWAKGESMQQLMKDNNISESDLQAKLKELRTQQLQTQLDALVANGVITQDQANQRLSYIQSQTQNSNGRHGFGGWGMGLMMGRRMGF